MTGTSHELIISDSMKPELARVWQSQRVSGRIIGSPAEEVRPAQVSGPKTDLLTVMDVVTLHMHAL